MNPPDECVYPLGVLLDRDHNTTVVRLNSLPPPREWYLPARRKMALRVDEPPDLPPPPHRVFRLTNFRSRDHRWWNVYNEGRSRTPEDGFVYFEAIPPRREE